MRLEFGLFPLPQLLLHQIPLLLFRPPHAEGSGRIVAVECLLGHKNVAGRAVGVGMVNFLQIYYCACHVAVHKVNTEVGVICFPPSAALEYESYQPGLLWKLDPVKNGV